MLQGDVHPPAGIVHRRPVAEAVGGQLFCDQGDEVVGRCQDFSRDPRIPAYLKRLRTPYHGRHGQHVGPFLSAMRNILLGSMHMGQLELGGFFYCHASPPMPGSPTESAVC